jgi:hypothetical protein
MFVLTAKLQTWLLRISQQYRNTVSLWCSAWGPSLRCEKVIFEGYRKPLFPLKFVFLFTNLGLILLLDFSFICVALCWHSSLHFSGPISKYFRRVSSQAVQVWILFGKVECFQNRNQMNKALHQAFALQSGARGGARVIVFWSLYLV